MFRATTYYQLIMRHEIGIDTRRSLILKPYDF